MVPPDPVKVMFGEAAFWQTEVVPLTVAVGNGLTVIVTLPDCTCEQAVVLPSWTLISKYSNVVAVVVGTDTVTLFPEAITV